MTADATSPSDWVSHPPRVDGALARLEADGQVLRGSFNPGSAGDEWCDRALLARIHRLTLGRLRKEIEAVAPAELVRFLLHWQHVHPGYAAPRPRRRARGDSPARGDRASRPGLGTRCAAGAHRRLRSHGPRRPLPRRRSRLGPAAPRVSPRWTSRPSRHGNGDGPRRHAPRRSRSCCARTWTCLLEPARRDSVRRSLRDRFASVRLPLRARRLVPRRHRPRNSPAAE